MSEPIDADTLAAHEAGHALMRWLLRGQATLTWIDKGKGCGMSEGDGRMDTNIRNLFLINLAGVAVECGYGIGQPTWEGPFDDIDDTRRVINGLWGQLQTKYQSDTECLDALLRCACEILFPHMDLIQDITDALLEKGKVTPVMLKRLCKRHGVMPMTPEEYKAAVPDDLLAGC